MIDLSNTWCEATEENWNKLESGGIFLTEKLSYEYFKSTVGIEKGDFIEITIKEDCYFNVFSKKCTKVGRQIHLVNGQFKYVENLQKKVDEERIKRFKNDPVKPIDFMQGGFKEDTSIDKEINEKDTRKSIKLEKTKAIECQFTKYGFEKPSFECEILKLLKHLTSDNEFYIGYVIGGGNRYIPCFFEKDGSCYVMNDGDEPYDLPLYNLTPLKKEWYESKDMQNHIVEAIINLRPLLEFSAEPNEKAQEHTKKILEFNKFLTSLAK